MAGVRWCATLALPRACPSPASTMSQTPSLGEWNAPAPPEEDSALQRTVRLCKEVCAKFTPPQRDTGPSAPQGMHVDDIFGNAQAAKQAAWAAVQEVAATGTVCAGPACPLCKNAVKLQLFTSKADMREFTISGMCKSCQDRFFEA